LCCFGVISKLIFSTQKIQGKMNALLTNQHKVTPLSSRGSEEKMKSV
jgi:hypothetical protein